jgi:hemerythrin-like domain-containing protein
MNYTETLAAQHRACDADLVRAEQLAQGADWHAAERAVSNFVDHTEAHLRYEEQDLFPRLEAALPMAAGPTAVMRGEHGQIRTLFAELTAAVAAQDAGAVSDTVETLLLVLQQHNAKEEAVLYPLADRELAADPRLASSMEQVG